MKLSSIFIIALAIVFFLLGFNALQDAKPSHKNQRIYKALKAYMPYYLEKRIGGFSILSKDDNIKEKPPITEVYRRLEQLEQGWGKKHLKIKNDKLLIVDKNGTILGKISFLEPKEKKWVEVFFKLNELNNTIQ